MAANDRSKEIVAQFWQNITQGDANTLARSLAPNFVLHDLVTGETLSADRLRAGRSNTDQGGRVTIVAQYAAEGNHVVTHFTVSGAEAMPGADSAPIHAMAVSRMEGDQMAECSLLWPRVPASQAAPQARAIAGEEAPIENWRWPPWQW